VQDSSDFSSFQLDRLVKQSQLSQRLENVRMEMNYSAGGVENIVGNATEDATVESSQLASDELSHYVLIKGNLNKEEDTTTENEEATPTEEPETVVEEAETAPEDGAAAEEVEQKPDRKPAHCRMNDQFVMRKIERDRKAGCQFAPVRELKLSSSGSSSESDEDERLCRAARLAEASYSESIAAAQAQGRFGNLLVVF